MKSNCHNTLCFSVLILCSGGCSAAEIPGQEKYDQAIAKLASTCDYSASGQLLGEVTGGQIDELEFSLSYKCGGDLSVSWVKKHSNPMISDSTVAMRGSSEKATVEWLSRTESSENICSALLDFMGVSNGLTAIIGRLLDHQLQCGMKGEVSNVAYVGRDWVDAAEVDVFDVTYNAIATDTMLIDVDSNSIKSIEWVLDSRGAQLVQKLIFNSQSF